MARPGLVLARAGASALSQLGRYVAHGQLRHDDRVIDLVSVHPLAKVVPAAEIAHLPPIEVRRRNPAVWYSDLYFYLLGHALAGGPAVVGGDWNTSRIFDDSLFDRAAAAGWLEVQPNYHDGRQIRTWYRRADRPHGLDHLFCLGPAADAIRGGRVDASVTDSTVDHQGRGLSDHALAVMDIDLAAIPPVHGEVAPTATTAEAIAQAKYTDIATETYTSTDGTRHDVVPSEGSVFIFGGGEAVHHKADCPYAARTTNIKTIADPDRDLWRRLLDGRVQARHLADAGHEQEAERGIARELGLINTDGKPAWVCCVLCLLRPQPEPRARR
jgi:hypothetical protein